MVVHICNPNFWGGRDRRISFYGLPGQVLRHYFKNKLGEAACACGPSYSGGKGKRFKILGPKMALDKVSAQTKKAKKGWRMAQVTKHLPSKQEAQNSIPIPQKLIHLKIGR
jgi:hypothetical protein